MNVKHLLALGALKVMMMLVITGLVAWVLPGQIHQRQFAAL